MAGTKCRGAGLLDAVHDGGWCVSPPKQDQAQRDALAEGRKEASEEASDMEKAADFGRLRTMKVQQATAKVRCWDAAGAPQHPPACMRVWARLA